MEQRDQLPAWATRFGYAGVIPQAVFAAMAVAGGEAKWIAQAGGFAYAALIFSFLGGVWWAQALAAPAPKLRHFGISVAPSLIGLACFMPWVFGLPWPAPYLAVLGVLLALSPLADRQLFGQNRPTPAWLRLRGRLSIMLGALTLVLAFA